MKIERHILGACLSYIPSSTCARPRRQHLNQEDVIQAGKEATKMFPRSIVQAKQSWLNHCPTVPLPLLKKSTNHTSTYPNPHEVSHVRFTSGHIAGGGEGRRDKTMTTASALAYQRVQSSIPPSKKNTKFRHKKKQRPRYIPYTRMCNSTPTRTNRSAFLLLTF